MKAIWNDATIAESDKTIVIEDNHYFPPDDITTEHFQPSDTHTTCPWKGEASYYNVVVNGEVNKDAAWYYPEPKPAAAEIKDYVAFWKGVKEGVAARCRFTWWPSIRLSQNLARSSADDTDKRTPEGESFEFSIREF